MSTANKTACNVGFSIRLATVVSENVEIKCRMENHFGSIASLGDLQYSLDLGNSWNDGTLAASQYESDLNNIAVSSSPANRIIVWNAAADINILEEFTNVKIRLTFFDDANQSGSESDAVTYSISSVDMRPDETVELTRPYDYDPDFTFKFKQLLSVQVVKNHFRVEVAELSDTDFSNPVFYAESETDQTGWTFDGNAFPAEGVDSVLSRSSQKYIEFSSATLAALDSSEYNVRVLRSLHDPDGILMPTYPW